MPADNWVAGMVVEKAEMKAGMLVQYSAVQSVGRKALKTVVMKAPKMAELSVDLMAVKWAVQMVQPKA